MFTCLSKASLDHLQLVQNAAAKLLRRSSRCSHISPLLISHLWLPNKFRNQSRVQVLTELYMEKPPPPLANFCSHMPPAGLSGLTIHPYICSKNPKVSVCSRGPHTVEICTPLYICEHSGSISLYFHFKLSDILMSFYVF